MMTYNPQTRELRDSEGNLLKRLNCPLHKRWDELEACDCADQGACKVGCRFRTRSLHPLVLEPIPSPTENRRFCQSCERCVHDVTEKTEDELKEFLQSGDSLWKSQPCLYISPKAQHIQILPVAPESPCPIRTIKAIFRPEEAEEGEKQGLVLMRFSRLSLLGSYVVWDQETNKSWISSDRRTHYIQPPLCILKNPEPAYLLLPDLAIGERVFIPQLIGVNHLRSGFARWDGKRFQVENLRKQQLKNWWESQFSIG